MRHNYLFLLILVPFLAYSGANAQIPQATIMPGRMIFKLKPAFRNIITNNKIQNDKLAVMLQDLDLKQISQKYPRTTKPEGNPEAVDLTLIYEVKTSDKFPFAKVKNTLLQSGLFEYVEQLRAYEPLYQPNDPLADSATAGTQYHLKNIKAYHGWDFEKGDTSIVIGILDTGTRYSHQDLKKNIKYNYADRIDGIDNDNDGYIDNFRGWDVAENDNDASTYPFGDHGAYVCGVASASTDNGKGVAGVGFKCKFLPIKIYANTNTGSFAGFEGIVYAADHGCSIINLSWGGEGSPSFYEQDVITYAAINKNAVVVVAAGNTNGKLDFFPASYKNALSVAALDAQNIKGGSNTYSYNVDLSAPGISILTTSYQHDSAYAAVTGSSFACPIVAGAAGLVKKHFPQFNSQQIAEQLRVTADASIYALPGNANYQELLGKGILNVAKALTTTNAKSVRYTNITINQGDLLYPGDTLKLIADFKNFLQPVANLNVSVTSSSPYVTITQPNFAAGARSTLATFSNTLPFKIYIAPNTPVNQKVALRFTFSDGTYTDYQYYEVILNPDYVTLNINKLAVTVTSTGNIGFKDLNPGLGNGVRYRKINLLSEAGLMIGNSPTTVSDNIRVTANTDTDFLSLTNVHFINALPRADIEAEGMMQDSFPQSAGTVGTKINYRAYAWQTAPNDKFVIVEYKIGNNQTNTLTNLYAGMFADWDIFDSGRNVALWDATNKMGYVYNVKYDTLYAAIKLLTPGLPSYYAIDNVNSPAGTIKISDGFTNAEKFQALSGGVARTTGGSLVFGNDVSFVIGTKLPDLTPTQTSTAAFAIIAGDNLADIQASAQAAQIKYNTRSLGQPEALNKETIKIYPNPASEQLQIKLPVQNTSEYSVEVLNSVGKTVAKKQLKPGDINNLDVKTLSAGLYLVKISNGKTTYTEKIQIIR